MYIINDILFFVDRGSDKNGNIQDNNKKRKTKHYKKKILG